MSYCVPDCAHTPYILTFLIRIQKWSLILIHDNVDIVNLRKRNGDTKWHKIPFATRLFICFSAPPSYPIDCACCVPLQSQVLLQWKSRIGPLVLFARTDTNKSIEFLQGTVEAFAFAFVIIQNTFFEKASSRSLLLSSNCVFNPDCCARSKK